MILNILGWFSKDKQFCGLKMTSQESSLKSSVRHSLNHGQFFYSYGGVIQGSVVFAKYPSLMNGKVKAKRINCFIHAHLRVIGRVNYDRYIPPLVPSDKYYVIKSVFLCKYTASLSSLMSVEDVLLYYQIMENEFRNFEDWGEGIGTGWKMHANPWLPWSWQIILWRHGPVNLLFYKKKVGGMITKNLKQLSVFGEIL